jgi:diguanylate cyclase
MSHPESAAQAKTPVHWTVKSNYRLRTGSFAIMFTSIVFHGWDKNYSPAFWSLIALHLLVYPHLMFWRARRAANTQQAEVNNLAMDSLLFGILAAALQFPLWISFTVYIASTLNITISRGTRGMLLSQLGFFGGALIPIVLFGWHVSPDTGWPATLVCLAGNMVYMISIGIAAFGRNQQLRKTREALRLGEQTLKQQLAEIQNLQEKLQEQASRDPLTGMYNRRFLDTIVGREIARCHRESQHLTVMMIDVDHFKKVNDTYGHPGGDEVLKNLAALLIGKVRVTDVPCRYGGEEFLLLLPGMPPDIAMLRAETWRTAFAEMTSALGGVTIRATMSIGVAVYPGHGETLTELTHCADLALYRAKQEGRNRAVLYRAELATDKT